MDMANPRWWVRVMRGGATTVHFEPLPEHSHPVAELARKKKVGEFWRPLLHCLQRRYEMVVLLGEDTKMEE